MIAIIPARYESSRFEGKPLAAIMGKPMIQWVYERVTQTRPVLSDVIVATDDDRIVAAVKTFGGHAMLTSSKNRSGTDRVAEAAEKAGAHMDDIVINIQGDQPLLHPDCINDLTTPFFTEPGLEMATLAYRTTDKSEIENPKDVKVTFDMNGYALYFSRSPIPFSRNPGLEFDTHKHLGFYAYTRRFLEMFRSLPEGILERVEKLEQLRALEYGHRIKVVVTPHDSPEVDLPQDIQRVEKMISEQKSATGE
ncbi:MAG: 3-deoxy-manno-octulosonate cytidylyltransferase [Desulfobacterales bacterium]